MDFDVHIVAASTGSSQNARDRSPRYDTSDHGGEKSYFRDDSRSESRGMRRRHSTDREEQNQGRVSRNRYEREYSEEYERKRSRYEDSRWTPDARFWKWSLDNEKKKHKKLEIRMLRTRRSDWDDGRWEWEDTPHRDSQSNSSRHHQPSPSPMLIGASPDARLVSPWLGGHTPQSVNNGMRTGHAASPWDTVSPSPVPIRASGSSVRSSNTRYGGRSHQRTSSANNSHSSEDREADNNYFSKDNDPEITESMHLEMEYNSDRAWYDRE
ncbi:hypothetical protein CsSME_00021643 [Camellia sinensis var. sinensis]